MAIRFGPFLLDAERGVLSRDGVPLQVQPKVIALVAHLVQHAGELRTRDQILDAVWPGVVVGDDALTQILKKARIALGDKARNPTWIQTVHRRGYRFIGVVAPLVPAERLFGREEEVAALGAALDGGVRLITLTGLGGIGKTSLARAVLAERGGWFVELASTRTADEVASAVAGALDVGIPDGPGSTLARLGEVLHLARGLLVLDNVEQVLDAIAEAVGSWLRAAPNLTLLITSRVPLEMIEERRVPVAALAPQSATELLRARVERLDARIAKGLTDASLSRVVASLDGHPLALELVAPRLLVTPAEQLAARLPSQELLSSSERDRPARHRSLNAAMSWSWEALAVAEREALIDLAAFRGPITTPLASAVLGEQALAVLQALVDASWLVPVSGGQLSHHMLRPVRSFVRALAAAGRWRLACERHQVAVLAHSPSWEIMGPGAVPGSALRGLRVLAPDLAAIVERAEAPRPRAEACLRLALVREADGMPASALALLDALDLDDLPATLAARALLIGSLIAQGTLGVSESLERAQRARERARAGGEVDLERYARVRMANALLLAGRLEEGRELAASVLGSGADDRIAAMAGVVHAAVQLRLGDVDAAEQAAESALRIAFRTGDEGLSAIAHNALAGAAQRRGRSEEEIRHRRLALDATRRNGARVAIVGHLLNLATALRKSRPARPEPLLEEALEEARRIGNQRLLAYCTRAMANLCTDLGAHEDAVRLSEESVSVFERAGSVAGSMHARLSLGVALACAGDPHAAIRLAEGVLERSGHDSDVVLRFDGHRVGALAAVLAGDGLAAMEHARALDALVGMQDAKVSKAWAAALLAAGGSLSGTVESGQDEEPGLEAAVQGADRARMRALRVIQLPVEAREAAWEELRRGEWYAGDGLTRAFVDVLSAR